MKKTFKKSALGVAIIAGGLAVAATATATQGHWQNLANRSMYLGVAGGAQHCNPRWCYLNEGTSLVVWKYAGTWLSDQYWYSTAPGEGLIRNYYNRYPDSAPMCIGVQGGASAGPGAKMITWHCDANQYPDHTWVAIASDHPDIQAPFPGCYVFKNKATNLVMGVAGGNVSNGAQVIQWPLCTPNTCGSWHQDQFWCPA